MSIYARLVLAGLVLAGIAAGLWWDRQRLARADAEGYERRRVEEMVAAELQRESNRAAAREAEATYTAAAQVRERIIVETITEVRHATAPVADCVLPADARQLLNDAASRAGEDRPAPGGAGLGLRPPR